MDEPSSHRAPTAGPVRRRRRRRRGRRRAAILATLIAVVSISTIILGASSMVQLTRAVWEQITLKPPR